MHKRDGKRGRTAVGLLATGRVTDVPLRVSVEPETWRPTTVEARPGPSFHSGSFED